MKKTNLSGLILILTLMICISLLPIAVFASAKPTSSTVLVNGNSIAFDAYNINDNNYFKLRDLAYTLSGSAKQFAVTWDEEKDAINLLSGEAYTVVGGEMETKDAEAKAAEPTTSKIYLDGTEVALTAYHIGGNNYFKLRDIGAAIDFCVDWDDASNTIVIDTSAGYMLGDTAGDEKDDEPDDLIHGNESGLAVGSFTINVEKIPFAEPLMVEDDFGSAFFAVSGDIYYVLADNVLKQYKFTDGSLVYEKELPLSGKHDYIFTDDNGILYASRLGNDFVAFEDGKQIFAHEGFDSVTVYPSGEWGISWFVGANVDVLWIDGDEIRYDNIEYPEPYMISSLNINQNHIIISGTTHSNETSGIFVYNEEDDTLELTLGDKKSGEPGYMSNVTAVAETKNGYMALDANMRTILFWKSDGTYIDTVDDKDLFGTNYPWLCTAFTMPDGSILVGMTDGPISGDSDKEFMIYRLTGF